MTSLLPRPAPATAVASAPVPPPLPEGATVVLPGRGEVFVRHRPLPGSGRPPVLLLHGWTVTADLNFFPLYTALRDRWPVVALDHRGHGRGMRAPEPVSLEDCADDAAALLRHLGYDRAVAVGYSMGGAIALLLARRHPHLVVGLVSQATALEWRASLRERLTWRLLPLLEVALRSRRNRSIVERWVHAAADRRPELRPLLPWLVGETRRGEPTGFVEAGWALSQFDARGFASSLGVPAAVVQTTRDRLVRPRKQARLAKALDATVLPIRADHDAPLAAREAYVAATLQALDAVTDAGLARSA